MEEAGERLRSARDGDAAVADAFEERDANELSPPLLPPSCGADCLSLFLAKDESEGTFLVDAVAVRWEEEVVVVVAAEADEEEEEEEEEARSEDRDGLALLLLVACCS